MRSSLGLEAAKFIAHLRPTRGPVARGRGIRDAPPRMSRVVAFTDGGCRGNPGVGAWAFVLVDVETRKALEGAGGETLTTNNRMEMGAAIAALEAVKKLDTKILIVSDSKYLIGC